nr:hypothetical protein [Tanacetum cinerariifolium]
IIMENPNHLNEPNEAIPEVNPVVPEPNQVVDIHDPNEMVDIPDDIDLVDYDEGDSKEEPEEEPEEDVNIKLEDDAELIFPYEVEAEKTPPPGDVSSDSVSFESESENEEDEPEEEPEEDVNIELEDDVELIFLYEVEGDKTPPPGDVSSDSVTSESEAEDEEVYVAPEAIIGTITQKPYAIHDFLRGLFEVGESSSAHDSSNVDGLAPWALRRDLEASRMGNVLERVSVLESEENAALKKRLAETKTKAVLKPPYDDEDSERLRKKSKKSTFDGTEGPFEPHGPPSDS